VNENVFRTAMVLIGLAGLIVTIVKLWKAG
jgi:hypothetical protein